MAVDTDRDVSADGAMVQEPTQDHPVAQGYKKILIVDDDVALAKFLGRELSALQFVTTVHHDGEAALLDAKAAAHDLVILDMNMPKMDGMEFLRQIRPSYPQLPVLVLTARNSTEDLVRALDSGADDFLIKPFSFLELLARIRSLLRRQSAPAMSAAARVGDLVLSQETHSVTRGARSIELTLREFALLEYLMQHAGRPVSRVTLLREVWNIDADPSTNIVDVYMKYLRDKIDVPGEAKLIRTIRGVGYVLSGE
ncbi:MAG TPA: response regulator transcription factor [Acidobacteriaceae bacterium]